MRPAEALPGVGGGGPPSMLEIALSHAAKGYYVLPVVPDGKSALSKHWQVLATRDPAAITRWWTDHPDANPAIHTGKSGVLIADLDVKNGAQGPEIWAEWTASHQVDPGWPLADTPTGGRHLCYRTTGEFGNRVGMLPGVDVRAGNGYVLAPGSVVGGRRYASPDGGFALPSVSDLPGLPEAVAALVGRRDQEVERHSAPVGDSGVAAALVAELVAVAQEPEGTRNKRLNEAALNLGQLVQPDGLPESLAFDSLVQAGLRAGLGWDETVATVNSGLEAGMRQPRSLATSEDEYQQEVERAIRRKRVNADADLVIATEKSQGRGTARTGEPRPAAG